jgi:tRNA(fMet)-specific endonuclease VapC
MACLDTDFLIDISRNDKKAIDKINDLSIKGDILFTTTINMAEYYAGAFKSKAKDAVKNAQEYLQQFSILTLDENASIWWGRLYNELKSKSIGDRDLFIASIALTNKQVLITRNKKHFERVPGLKIEMW